MRQRLAMLLRGREDARLAGYACFGLCELGPNVLFYPEGAWYGGLNGADAAGQVEAHTLGADMPGEPLAVPEPERSVHLRNVADLVGTLERDRARTRARRSGSRRWWPF